jgi:hypothetical protein
MNGSCFDYTAIQHRQKTVASPPVKANPIGISLSGETKSIPKVSKDVLTASREPLPAIDQS